MWKFSQMKKRQRFKLLQQSVQKSLQKSWQWKQTLKQMPKDGGIQAKQKFWPDLMLMQTIGESQKSKLLKMEIRVFKVNQKALVVHPVVKLDHRYQKMWSATHLRLNQTQHLLCRIIHQVNLGKLIWKQCLQIKLASRGKWICLLLLKATLVYIKSIRNLMPHLQW